MRCICCTAFNWIPSQKTQRISMNYDEHQMKHILLDSRARHTMFRGFRKKNDVIFVCVNSDDFKAYCNLFMIPSIHNKIHRPLVSAFELTINEMETKNVCRWTILLLNKMKTPTHTHSWWMHPKENVHPVPQHFELTEFPIVNKFGMTEKRKSFDFINFLLQLIDE